MSTIPELTKQARDLMHKAVESTKREFSSIRSGKASVSLSIWFESRPMATPCP